MSTSNKQDTPAEDAEGEEKSEKAEEKDSVDGEKSAAINAIVCSFCDLPETETRNFSKTKCPCKSTWYCNTTCQKKHWHDHKAECKRLRVELNRKRQEKRIRKTNNVVVGDDCSVCLEELSRINSQVVRNTCCGKAYHKLCYQQIKDSNMSEELKNRCAECRQKYPSGPESVEEIRRLRMWAEKGRAWSQEMLANRYREGVGLVQNYVRAAELYQLAIEHGDIDSMYHLGSMYFYGKGVEQSYERAKDLYERAAHFGHIDAQYKLGVMYDCGRGVTRSFDQTIIYYKLAAAQGHGKAEKELDIKNPPAPTIVDLSANSTPCLPA